MKIVQKFHKGDRVTIGPLPKTMSHFPRGNATVIGSYYDLYRAWAEEIDKQNYAIRIDGLGYTSWYPEEVLILLTSNGKCPTCGHTL